MSKFFNTNMSSLKAMNVLYKEIDGKSEEEKRELYDEYEKISSIIFQREMDRAAEGWMC